MTEVEERRESEESEDTLICLEPETNQQIWRTVGSSEQLDGRVWGGSNMRWAGKLNSGHKEYGLVILCSEN